jgi:hypothetical protein
VGPRGYVPGAWSPVPLAAAAAPAAAAPIGVVAAAAPGAAGPRSRRGVASGPSPAPAPSAVSRRPGWCDGVYDATIGRCFPRRGGTQRKRKHGRKTRRTRRSKTPSPPTL